MSNQILKKEIKSLIDYYTKKLNRTNRDDLTSAYDAYREMVSELQRIAIETSKYD